jgi:hypothetical protein
LTGAAGGLPLHCIGEIEREPGVRGMRGGRFEPLAEGGYDHFA